MTNPEGDTHAVLELPALNAAERSAGLWIETAFVLLVCVGPYLYGALDWVVSERPAVPRFDTQIAYGTFRSTCNIAIVLFVIWRSGERWRRFGIGPVRPLRDSLSGVGIMLLGYASYVVIWFGMYAVAQGDLLARLTRPDLRAIAAPRHAVDFLPLALLCVVNAAAEELLMRGYMLTRLEQICRSTAAALVLSTLIFAGYHIYQGAAGTIGAGVLGIVYGSVFIFTRRVWPLVIAHALYDLAAVGILAMRR